MVDILILAGIALYCGRLIYKAYVNKKNGTGGCGGCHGGCGGCGGSCHGVDT